MMVIMMMMMSLCSREPDKGTRGRTMGLAVVIHRSAGRVGLEVANVLAIAGQSPVGNASFCNHHEWSFISQSFNVSHFWTICWINLLFCLFVFYSGAYNHEKEKKIFWLVANTLTQGSIINSVLWGPKSRRVFCPTNCFYKSIKPANWAIIWYNIY